MTLVTVAMDQLTVTQKHSMTLVSLARAQQQAVNNTTDRIRLMFIGETQCCVTSVTIGAKLAEGHIVYSNRNRKQFIVTLIETLCPCSVSQIFLAQAACVHLRFLLLTHFGETPICEIIFHPIYICKIYMQYIYAKKNIFWG